MVSVEWNVPARMRDGVTLRANVYRPEREGPWPTLLMRTPYGKDDPTISATLDPVRAARAGYLVAVQDVRGRFASEGAWSPFEYEGRDGFDAVEWAARLPGSNGRVGMFGGSYCGMTQLLAAVERPPALTAIAPLVTWADPLDGVAARGGAVELGLSLSWALETTMAQLARLDLSPGERERRLAALIDDYDRLAVDGCWDLPVGDMAVLRRHGDPPGLGGIPCLEPGVAWSSIAGRHERIEVPALHIGGWHDLFVQGTLDNHAAMTALGRPSRLVVGPWAHGDTRLGEAVGELRFGMRARGTGVPVHERREMNDLQLDWLGGEADPPAQPVRIFVMGRNEWRGEDSWPPRRARAQRWFLGAGGTLGLEPPQEDGLATRFRYDPADPAPTVGGQVLMGPAFPPGPHDQSVVERRADVCVFTSRPLSEELEVTGRVRVVLHVESSAPSTDWVARLCDVHPDGRSFNVCDGLVRVSDSAQVRTRHEVDLWSTSNVFLRGHRLRVHVTSSSFPRWDRNLNTGNQRDARAIVAEQHVHHAAQRPSYIELPVVT